MDTNTPEIPKDIATPNISQVKTETVTTSDSPIGTDSSIGNISVRAIIALIITITLCAMSVLKYDVKEPFYSIAVFTIGFFFGQKVVK